jgi:ABC-type transporter MlaC component
MKRVFTSKQERKQAEDSILGNMQSILSRLKKHKQTKTEEKVDKQQVLSVLTQYLKIKKITKS